MNLNNIGIIIIIAVAIIITIITLSTQGTLIFNRNRNDEPGYQHFHIVTDISRADTPLYLLTWVVSGMLMVLHS